MLNNEDSPNKNPNIEKKYKDLRKQFNELEIVRTLFLTYEEIEK